MSKDNVQYVRMPTDGSFISRTSTKRSATPMKFAGGRRVMDLVERGSEMLKLESQAREHGTRPACW
jgi:hypothetical protein